ncbi:phosphate ABC transporter substrate-binding/OmpA family protein [Winogradskyella ludwigii]|uniref:phosphate ABC transporter substrate-binding/OmpA family protein n=1 Tax=Winogradskyella ludwigii TaxID=2686076 RepID=UPI0015C6A979|nr:phosphate ABC transporter substrate-binding/OmpA family protein [Winogradskyella ludwigii]
MKNSTSEQQQCFKCKQSFESSIVDEKICVECKEKVKKNKQLVIGVILGLVLLIASGSFYFYNQKITPDATFEGVVDNDTMEIDNVILKSNEATVIKQIVSLGEAVDNLTAFKRFSEDNNGIPSKIQVLFDKNETEISESDGLFLTHFAKQFIELGDDYTLLLEGYTCDLGTDRYNLILSINRAQVIKDYLNSKNINSKQIETKSYGKDQFVNTGDLEQSRAENRRVYITIYKGSKT